MARAWRVVWAWRGRAVGALSTTTWTRRSGLQARRRPAITGATKKRGERAPRGPARPPDTPALERPWHGAPATMRTR
eukprot:6229532-Alexandrium_andersonii.AAC.1